MDLTNTTPLAAELRVGRRAPSGRRIGLAVAKATFRYDDRGETTLDTQSPIALFCPDEPTPLGLLPRDDLPRNDRAFEVSLLGCAHAPGGRPTGSMVVAMTVGEERREMHVSGDREWIGKGGDARISEPVPFTRMPLTWSRAFGGSADVEVDADSPVVVTHQENPLGIGFDPEPHARELDRFLTCPAGYPRYDERRRLPNLERPEARIRAWDDRPGPICWAPVPMTSSLQTAQAQATASGEREPARVVFGPRFHRAHPDWVLEAPPAACAWIKLEGLSPEGSAMFRVPPLRVHLDYLLGARAGSRELWQTGLVVLPEERRFYLVYRLPFEVDDPEGRERGARLRIEEKV